LYTIKECGIVINAVVKHFANSIYRNRTIIWLKQVQLILAKW